MALALFTKISIPGFKISHFALAFKDKKLMSEAGCSLHVWTICLVPSLPHLSIPPKVFTAFSTALIICCSSLTLTTHGKAFPPAASTAQLKNQTFKNLLRWNYSHESTEKHLTWIYGFKKTLKITPSKCNLFTHCVTQTQILTLRMWTHAPQLTQHFHMYTCASFITVISWYLLARLGGQRSIRLILLKINWS